MPTLLLFDLQTNPDCVYEAAEIAAHLSIAPRALLDLDGALQVQTTRICGPSRLTFVAHPGSYFWPIQARILWPIQARILWPIGSAG